MADPVREFFRNNTRRSHAATAKLLDVSPDWLHTWQRRYAAGKDGVAPALARQRAKARKQGGYAKRIYDNDVLAVFLIAYGLNDLAIETKSAIQAAMQIYSAIKREVIEPACDGELRDDLMNTIALLAKQVGHKHRIHIVDRRNFLDAMQALSGDHVIQIPCGIALIKLIEHAAASDASDSEAEAA